MPGLVCPSPAILDHSFPRSEEELRGVAIALGEIQRAIEDAQVELLVTGALQEFIDVFEWEDRDNYSLVNDVYRLWFCSFCSQAVKLSV